MRYGLLLIDLQQDYLDRLGMEPSKAQLIPKIAQLLNLCRGHAIPVFHARTLVRPDGANRMPHWQAAGLWACVEGTAGAEPPPELVALAGETVIAKTFYSAFEQPNLLDLLKAAGIETLIIAGIYTHACIRASALDAYRHGFQVRIVTDAIASTEPMHARLTLDHLQGRAVTCTPIEELAELFSHADAPPPAAQRYWKHRNPSRWDEVLAEIPLGGPDDAKAAVMAATAQATAWRHTPHTARLAALQRWMTALEACRSRAIALLVREVGKPSTSANAEVDYALALLAYTISQLRLGVRPEAAGRAQIRYAPFGPVGLITPWNNPLAIPAGKIAPALAFGNTVVWKPALQAPALAHLLLETLTEAGLHDFVSLLTGDAQTARHLLAQPDLRAISFTGSIAAGREVAYLCAAQGKVLQAELGGNNAVIITADTDIERAARELAPALFSFSGQRCTAPRRLIVEAEVQPAFEAALVQATLALKLGDPALSETEIGPLISRDRQDHMAALITDALNAGGRLLCGGQRPANLHHGCWFEPTLIAGASLTAAAVCEEAFGPLAVIITADNFEIALNICNAVPHGLVATLYSENAETQKQFLDRAEAGILVLNRPMAPIDPAAPFSGWKASGFGPPEHGRWDFETYTRPQAIYR